MNTVNVFAPELRNIVKKEVPFIPGAWVEFWDDIEAGSINKAQELQTTQDIEGLIELLTKQIAAWNFSEGIDQPPLPINTDTISKLSLKMITWLSKSQAEVLESSSITDDKKKE